MKKKVWIFAALVPLLGACDSTSGPNGAGPVAVRFQAGTSTVASASLSPSDARFDHVLAAGAITLTGTNGTLVIEDIRLIVSELELERMEGSCTTATDDDDDCPEFEGGPFLVNLLDGTAAQVVTATIPAGSYTGFEFKVEDLNADEDDDNAERQTMQNLLTQMRQAYPAFPGNASMVVHGTFNGQPFTVYFNAEIELEKEFATPFRVPEDAAILVNLDPSAWFKQGTQVVDLLALNGQTVGFELEIESGIEVEHDD